MSEDIKFTKTAIDWRRNIILQRLAKGYSQADIAKELQLHPSTISLDVQWLKEQAQRELSSHLSEKLPFEYSRAITGINDILRRASEMLDRMTEPKMQLQTMTLLMQLYGQIMSLATDGGIIEQAMKKVEGLESNRSDSLIKEEQPLASFDANVSEEETEPEEDIEKE